MSKHGIANNRMNSSVSDRTTPAGSFGTLQRYEYQGIPSVPFVFGLEDFISKSQNIAYAFKPSYPPYDLSQKDNKYFLSIAMAGFDKKEISVVKEKNILKITAKQQKQEADKDLVQYHQGIAKRDVDMRFSTTPDIKVVSVSMSNGMLNIVLEKIIPKEDLPVEFEIL